MSKIRLFLSSPGDVETERKMVHAVVNEINRWWGDVYAINMEVIDWKTHVAPDTGRPQAKSNHNCAALVGQMDFCFEGAVQNFQSPIQKRLTIADF